MLAIIKASQGPTPLTSSIDHDKDGTCQRLLQLWRNPQETEPRVTSWTLSGVLRGAGQGVCDADKGPGVSNLTCAESRPAEGKDQDFERIVRTCQHCVREPCAARKLGCSQELWTAQCSAVSAAALPSLVQAHRWPARLTLCCSSTDLLSMLKRTAVSGSTQCCTLQPDRRLGCAAALNLSQYFCRRIDTEQA